MVDSHTHTLFSQVHREYVLQCFLERYPVLKDVMEYEYEPNGQDQVCAIAKEHGAEIFLDKDARKWAMKLTKDNGAISEKMKQVRGLKSVTMAYTKVSYICTRKCMFELRVVLLVVCCS